MSAMVMAMVGRGSLEFEGAVLQQQQQVCSQGGQATTRSANLAGQQSASWQHLPLKLRVEAQARHLLNP